MRRWKFLNINNDYVVYCGEQRFIGDLFSCIRWTAGKKGARRLFTPEGVEVKDWREEIIRHDMLPVYDEDGMIIDVVSDGTGEW
jgi:hypothetical protein